jgi:hypothetical protein
MLALVAEQHGQLIAAEVAEQPLHTQTLAQIAGISPRQVQRPSVSERRMAISLAAPSAVLPACLATDR